MISNIVLAMTLVFSANAGMILYTDQPSFVTAIGDHPYAVNNFDDLKDVWGSTPNLRYTYGNINYNIASLPEDAAYAMNGAVGALDNGVDGPVLRVFIDSYIRAIGMNVFGTDAEANSKPATDFTIDMYGVDEGGYYVGGATDGFYGFILGSKQTGAYLDIYNPNWATDNIYPSLDDIYISTMDNSGGIGSVDTPEPAVMILNGIVLAVGGGIAYIRRKNIITT